MNLVTGATGILGSHVVLKLLKQKQPVLASRQKTSSVEPLQKLLALHFEDWKLVFDRIKWIELDVSDIYAIEAALDGVERVYHCAGLVSFHSAQRQKMFEVNEQGTKNMVDACLTKPGIRFCHVSSIATINNLDYKLALNETVFWKTSGKESDYALSKYNAEREVWRGMEEGLKAVIVNPGVILAPVLWQQSSSRLFHSAYRGNSFYTRGTAAYVLADDVAEIMLRLIDEERFGERYILIENNYTFKEFMGFIQSVFHPQRSLIGVSKLLLRFVSIFENFFAFIKGTEPILTKALIHSAFNQQSFSNQKVLNDLNFDFVKTEECVTEICKMHLKEDLSKKQGNKPRPLKNALGQ